MTKTVVIGLSGGVDSSVAAALLLQQGYNVIGLFMNNWDDDDSETCTAAQDWQDVLSISKTLGIKSYSVNFSKQYYQNVFEYFLDSIKKGLTPNPDVLCNRYIKFGEFAKYAANLGADYIATGHYAGITHDSNGTPQLLRATDANKDQTYFLNQVTTAQLQNVLFPLGNIQKPDVRKIATGLGLVNSAKKDSTGICFIGERNFKSFLSAYFKNVKGDIIDSNGRKVGEHSGLHNYTIGQRRGLGVGGIKGCDANRWFVTSKDLQKNILYVSNGHDDCPMYSKVIIKNLNIIGGNVDLLNYACTAKFRYRQADCDVAVNKIDNDTAEIILKIPQAAITCGQYAVLYDGNRCLGGGEIYKVE